jgi:hypothetical protein
MSGRTALNWQLERSALLNAKGEQESRGGMFRVKQASVFQMRRRRKWGIKDERPNQVG